MGFVVKATGPGLSVTWLMPASDVGSHTLGARQNAVVFQTHAEAQAAADKLAESLGRLGFVFSVESAD
jgi:hypothetical protein